MTTDMWLIQGFDVANCKHFIPSPSLFRTEQEATEWCRAHSGPYCVYGYMQVTIGRYNDKCPGGKSKQ